jgi:hypothetical protein
MCGSSRVVPYAVRAWFLASGRRGVLGVDVRMNVDIKQYTVNNIVSASKFVLDKHALCIRIEGKVVYQRHASDPTKGGDALGCKLKPRSTICVQLHQLLSLV